MKGTTMATIPTRIEELEAIQYLLAQEQANDRGLVGDFKGRRAEHLRDARRHLQEAAIALGAANRCETAFNEFCVAMIAR